MSNTAIISLVISVSSFALGVIYKIIDLTSSFAKMSKTVDDLQKRYEQDAKANQETFRNIVRDTNRQETHLAKLEVTIQQMADSVKTIDKKLDKLLTG